MQGIEFRTFLFQFFLNQWQLENVWLWQFQIVQKWQSQNAQLWQSQIVQHYLHY